MRSASQGYKLSREPQTNEVRHLGSDALRDIWPEQVNLVNVDLFSDSACSVKKGLVTIGQTVPQCDDTDDICGPL